MGSIPGANPAAKGIKAGAKSVWKWLGWGAKAESKLSKFARFDNRMKVLESVTNADGSLRLSGKVEKQLYGVRKHIPTQAILEALGSGKRIPDPQNVPQHFMYTIDSAYAQGRGVLEVLVDEASGQIRHVLYRSNP